MAKAKNSLEQLRGHQMQSRSMYRSVGQEATSVAQLLRDRMVLMAQHKGDRTGVRKRLDAHRRSIKAEQNNSAFGQLQEDFDNLKKRVDGKKAMLARLEALAHNVHARATYAAEVVHLHHQALQGDEGELYEAVNEILMQIRRTREEWRLLNDKLDIKRQHQGQRKKDARARQIEAFDHYQKR